jgi:spore germination cell wall hydrolase CwlJ-like protein
MIPTPDFWAVCTIYMEAAGEPYLGKLCVAAVIRNRVRKHNKSVSDICFAPMQFSCWNADSPTRARLDEIDVETWESCEIAWEDISRNIVADPTKGATHYLNEEVTRRMRGGSLPSWFDENKVTLREGNHTFLRL